MNPLDRLPPQNLDAEKQVIGSALMEPKLLDRLSHLAPADFYADANRRLYGHLAAMRDNRERIDVTLVAERLRRAGDLEACGGAAYLGECAQAVPVAWNITHYANIVVRCSRRRQILEAARRATEAAYDDGTEPDEILATAEEALSAIRTGAYDRDPVSLTAATLDAVAAIDAMMQRGKHAGILTGLWEFDQQVGGFFPGELSIIAARPSQGKTSLALQFAAHAAQFHRVYFATLEMDRKELATKRLCSMAGVSHQTIRTGQLTREGMAALMEATTDIPEALFLHDWPEIRPFDIARDARRLKAEIVFVDYLQIVTPPDGTKKRYEQVGDVSRQLKTIARQLNAPVVACAQIGRQADQAKEARPRLSQLRESGNIEQDADVVALLWRPDDGIVGKPGGRYAGDKWDAELDVAKNRLGRATKFRLDWDGERTTFRGHGESDCRPASRETAFDAFGGVE